MGPKNTGLFLFLLWMFLYYLNANMYLLTKKGGTQNTSIWKSWDTGCSGPPTRSCAFWSKWHHTELYTGIHTTAGPAWQPPSFMNGSKGLSILTATCVCYDIKMSSSLTFKTTKKLDTQKSNLLLKSFLN